MFCCICVVWLLALSPYPFPPFLLLISLSFTKETTDHRSRKKNLSLCFLLFVCVCACVSYLCMCVPSVYVRVCVCVPSVCIFVCTCIMFMSGSWQENLQHHSSEAIYLPSLIQGSQWPGVYLLVYHGWSPSPKNPAVSMFPALDLQVCASKPSIFTCVLEFEHRSCL